VPVKYGRTLYFILVFATVPLPLIVLPRRGPGPRDSPSFVFPISEKLTFSFSRVFCVTLIIPL